jgi:hypothetical protein
MGYWGTLVVARPQGLLADQDNVSAFGHRHRWLRELGDGWQMLETSGVDDPPDLATACAGVAASTGYPALAVYISDDSCAALVTATLRRTGPLTHLWPVDQTCDTYRHQPRNLSEPLGRRPGDVVAELAAWASAAGLRADTDQLRSIIDQDGRQAYGRVVALTFELVAALGAVRIGRTRPWSLPAFDWPFSSVMFNLGPASRARQDAGYRAAGIPEVRPEQPWEAPAMALEAELWSSMYRVDVDAVALAHRTARQLAAFSGGDGDGLDETTLRRLAELEPWLASGTAPPWSDEPEERGYADAHATRGTVVR